MQHLRTDFLVIGSGIAGLSFALRTAKALPSAKVTILTKNETGESNTRYAQGGLAAVTHADDSFEKHIRDTLEAGDGLCDPEVVKTVVEESPLRLAELINWGAGFDRHPDHNLHLAREGGHSFGRIVHRADFTGLEIERTLVRAVHSMSNVEVLEHHLAVDLVVSQGEVRGVTATDLRNSITLVLEARATIIAAGGVGQVYKNTTNPLIATGDGIAMASRAGARLADMEYIQFHPTALYTGEEGSLFLVSEAVRGAGAFLVNKEGERFMRRYDPKADLACRDVVSRAIHYEMQKNDSAHVWLDCTDIDNHIFARHFPTILNKCLAMGIDPSRDRIPVVPAAHYCCGGIVTDMHGRTSLKRLYAIGESARTGLHGANRLASNSLSEALVFAARASAASMNERPCRLPSFGSIDLPMIKTTTHPRVAADRQTLKSLMSANAVVCDADGLQNAWNVVEDLRNHYIREHTTISENLLELRNLTCVAAQILAAAMCQTTNRGVFFKTEKKKLAQHFLP